MATTDDTAKLIECHSEEGVTSEAGDPVYPGDPPQQTYVTPETPPTYKESVDTPQPTAVVVHTAPQTSGMIRQAPSQPVKDYTIFAVIVTMCFFVPFGIVGIIKASEAKSKHNSGDEEGARQAAESAFGWSLSGLVCGIFLLVAFISFKLLAVPQ